MKYNNRVLRLRSPEELQTTRAELARKLEITHQAVTGFFDSPERVRLTTAARIASVLGKRPMDVLTDEPQ